MARTKVDLTPFIGEPNLLVRFEYVTDDAVQHQGFAVDDIRLDALNYLNRAETAAEAAEWEAVGFVRHGNILPQTWLVQQILLPRDQNAPVQVSRIPLNEVQQAEWVVPLGDEFGEAIIIVAATNPISLHPASYHLSQP
jgi:immune inhibitor A